MPAPSPALLRLLVLCAAPDLTSAIREEVRGLLVLGLDWESLLSSARREGLMPLLAKRLEDEARLVPGTVRGELRTAAYRSTANNLRALNTLGLFLDAAGPAAIPVAVTKGLRLADSLYDEPGLRPFQDVDLLARPNDWPRLRDLLERLGFCSSAPLLGPVSGRRLRWLFAPCYEKNGVVLEIHFAGLGLHLPLADEDGLWRSLERRTIGGLLVPVLSPEYELASLCTHAMQHSYERLIWLADVARFSRRERVDWAKLTELCRREGIRGPVAHGLEITEKVWPESVPRAALEALAPAPFERRLARFFWPANAVLRRTMSISLPYYAPTLFALLGRKRASLAPRALATIFFPPPAWVCWTYHIACRPAPLLRHYARRLFWPLWILLKRCLTSA